ncbi:hypothetical protein E6O75_ATG06189 [Venturia nashicola]|uniref:Uncharacterized protein n=1 Tax=Venturia nashicola TaxID=86259 RepID=A0A4Z1NZL1_9PEZI|nr:hypothetical protein E6O75_ATG06189 [Venturia nashicola]
MSSAGNTGSGSGAGGDKKGKGKSLHPVHKALSWRPNPGAESSKQTDTTVDTTTTPTTAPVVLPPRAPAPEIDFPQGCIKFPLTTQPAAHGRNQARRALHLAAKDRPDAWIVDLVKPIIRDANNRRGVFSKSAQEEG